MDLRRNIAVNKSIATLKKLRDMGLNFDRKRFIFEIMSEFQVSRRTATEYLETAENSFSQTITEIANETKKEINDILPT